jgi:GNAT superfamily N-acetyltransferase
MHIRQARASEAPGLSALALAAKHHWGYAAEDIERWRPLLTITQADLVSRPAFVAEIASGVAGFYALVPSGVTWGLEHLWVSPQFTRRGIGRALLAHAANTARAGGATSIAIDADPNAELFYRACGAVCVGSVAAPIASDPARIRPQLSLQVIKRAA